ncbi:Uncharacterised protein [Klebsiella quasipneumoniae]|nr:Uncharacterised protein [Klebsiella quasipneumoniae]
MPSKLGIDFKKWFAYQPDMQGEKFLFYKGIQFF